MFTNKLKLNPDKTEIILTGSINDRSSLSNQYFGNPVSLVPNVKNLGVVFSSNLSLSDHVSQIIKSTRFHTRDLYRIHHPLDLKTSVFLASAIVRSRMDYCNFPFASLADFELKRSQRVQNSLKFSHMTLQQKNLH